MDYCKVKPWYGVDFDGTLVESPKGVFSATNIGKPIWPMIERVKKWLAEGTDVKILTARAATQATEELREDNIAEIKKWCVKHIGQELEVTAEKGRKLIQLWDDRCVQVIENEGIPVGEEWKRFRDPSL